MGSIAYRAVGERLEGGYVGAAQAVLKRKENGVQYWQRNAGFFHSGRKAGGQGTVSVPPCVDYVWVVSVVVAKDVVAVLAVTAGGPCDASGCTAAVQR